MSTCRRWRERREESAEIRKLRSTSRYQRLRAEFLFRHPLCVGCLEAGRTTAAAEVDHIVEAHVIGPKRFFESANWRGLCKPCHRERHSGPRKRVSPERQEWIDRIAP